MLVFRRTLFLLPVPQRLVPLLVGWSFVLAGLGGIGFAVAGLLEERRWVAESVIVEARIVAKRTEQVTRDDKPETRYIAVYRFTARDGTVAEGRYTLEAEEWETLKEGDAVAVRYLPSDPHKNREAGEDGTTFLLLIMAGSAVFAVVGGLFLFFILRPRWRAARLRRTGLRAEATVVAVEPSWLAINDVTQMKVRFRFSDVVGRRHEACSEPLPPDEAEVWKAGDVGSVYYDPKRPTVAAWTGERQGQGRTAETKDGGRAL